MWESILQQNKNKQHFVEAERLSFLACRNILQNSVSSVKLEFELNKVCNISDTDTP